MELWNTTVTSLGLEINDDRESQIMANIWGKIHKEAVKPGFKNMFNAEEKALIKAISESWFGGEKKAEGATITSGLTHHNWGDE